jgi:hypothetical protein
MNREQGPLYWFLVSDREKPTDRKLLREPIVWFFLVGNAIWGFACMFYFLRPETGSILSKTVKGVVLLSAMVLPWVALCVRESGRSEARFSFEQLVIWALIAFFWTFFLGLGLAGILVVIMYFLGFHRFLGIPMP